MPIYNYFTEYIPRSEERDQEYRGKLREDYYRRQAAAAESAKEAMNLGRKLTDEDALRFLDLHLRGYSNGAISLMMNVPEYKVYHMMQMPLARYVYGARGREVLIGKKEQTVWPKVDAIKDALTEYGVAEDEWCVDMRKNGFSKLQLNKMLGVRKGKVQIKYAVAVAYYLKKNVDALFSESEKEK